jgi:hypothetical protein
MGRDSVDWYQEEIDRFNELSSKFIGDSSQTESNDTKESEQIRDAEYTKLLAGFSEPFLQV